MQADIFNLGKGFYKLAKVRDTELREDVADYDGEDTRLMDSYTLDTDCDDYIYSEQLGAVEIVRVAAVAVIGESWGGVRCYDREIVAYKDTQGRVWMDAELHDEVFC